MDLQFLKALIANGETLKCEFKADRGDFNDTVMIEEIVALANTDGGVLLVGVEDDGRISGARKRHDNTTDPLKIQSLIFNRTVPNVNTRVSWVSSDDGKFVLAIEVDPYPEICSTSNGTSKRRVIGGDGKPSTQPYHPRDQRSRRIDLGLLDYSGQTIEGLSIDDLDPLEFERLRQLLVALRGDAALLELSNVDLAKAMRLVETQHGQLTPNIAALLLLCRSEVLKRVLPTHQVNFQVFDKQDNVLVNESFDGAILGILDEIERRFEARYEEKEIQVGLFRFPIPSYARASFREALNNALLHRDYSQLGAIYIQWKPDHILITNPGGFPEGITTENILVHEPKPRNPRLAEAFKRLGLIEQTGRGVDRIYAGQLRYGRPIPDYTRSDRTGVRLILHGGLASLEFAAFVYEHERQGDILSLDEMIILNELFLQRRIDSPTSAGLIQKGTADARTVLEHLTERGLVEARGVGRGRMYHLAARVYQRFQMKSAYVRTKGFDSIQVEQMILSFIMSHGRITRAEAAELCQLSEDQSSRYLRRLAQKHTNFKMIGKGRNTYYEWIKT